MRLHHEVPPERTFVVVDRMDGQRGAGLSRNLVDHRASEARSAAGPLLQRVRRSNTVAAAILAPGLQMVRASPQPPIATVHERFSPAGYHSAMVGLKCALVALVLAVLGPLSAVPADAEPRLRCLSRDQQRSAIKERRAVPLAAVRRSVRARVPGELVRARLCLETDRLIYLLTVLPRDGRVRRVIVDAKNGAVMGVR